MRYWWFAMEDSKNLKTLNENLPKAKYDADNSQALKFKTAKIIKGCT